jgi:hypothetical protein
VQRERYEYFEKESLTVMSELILNLANVPKNSTLLKIDSKINYKTNFIK